MSSSRASPNSRLVISLRRCFFLTFRIFFLFILFSSNQGAKPPSSYHTYIVRLMKISPPAKTITKAQHVGVIQP
ncbi:uncharacterized protein B0H64DRAFT_7385 [Chaetomium fimeti]|uniref:Uncharacterized protein n=1 Tax=Chaetomium fimeti TaxID=1854472 RepID=A0AAE0HP39_9PEZI|nr:hypothetical protein B0H64DRAFT_7385 [Chaetomium fimeti]